MFSRGLIIVVMTAMTLLCPSFPCGECCATCPVVDVAENVESISHSETCCGRCQTAEENQADEHHSPLERDCPAGSEIVDCFCGGAILSADVDFPVDMMCEDFLSPTCDVTTLLQLSVLTQSELLPPSRCHFPPFSSGRDLCALTGSYLL
jgi:hypothetical protein